jgi:hypothetical protein
MKLARANLFVVHNDGLDRTAPRRRLAASTGAHRQSSKYPFIIHRAPKRLAAHWHICPQTQRLECAWSLEANSEVQLCRYPIRERRIRKRRLSQIRNRVL